MADVFGSTGTGALAGAGIGGPWGALAGGALGLGSGLLGIAGDKKNRELQAITAQYSPWTHLSPDQKSLEGQPNLLGDVATGALGGYDQIQKINQANAVNKLLEKQLSQPSGGSTALSLGIGDPLGCNPWKLPGVGI